MPVFSRVKSLRGTAPHSVIGPYSFFGQYLFKSRFSLVGLWPIRFFSDRKTDFTRDLNARYIAAFMLQLAVNKMVNLLEEMHILEEKYKDNIIINSESELAAYNIKKKILSIKNEITLYMDNEIGSIDGLIMILADKPD